jgi:hypothetical protein
MKKFEHVGTGNFNYDNDCPKWLVEWCSWTKDLLVPEWDINIHIADNPEPENEDTEAITALSQEYLSADIVFQRTLEDNVNGYLCVVHEICHIFFSRLGAAHTNTAKVGDTALKTLADFTEISYDDPYEPQMVIADKNYDFAEEESVVRLSRALLGLRQRILEKTNGNAKTPAPVDESTHDAD